jgi:hypothetical protein
MVTVAQADSRVSAATLKMILMITSLVAGPAGFDIHKHLNKIYVPIGESRQFEDVLMLA